MATADLDTALRDLEDEFALFSDWEERYGYVIELGRDMPPLPDADKTEANRVRGCASQVWLTSAYDAARGRMVFRGDSDAHIVRGLVALMIRLLSDRTPAEIAKADLPAVMARLGLDEALTPQRSNGLAALVGRMKAAAAAAG
ncbi:MAG: SufE family protein [Alphaproteobacteria bacterium]|nr:SufE family protein [Alphaproteobacteria bacterium]